MEINTIIGITAGILTAVSSMPQIIKTLKTKKVEGVSPLMFVVLLSGNGLWFYYGLLKDDLPIILTNAFSVILDVLMIFLKIKYRNNK